MSNGQLSTFEVFGPQPTQAESSATGSVDASATATPTKASSTETFSKTGLQVPISTNFPKCSIPKESKNPFCLPSNATTLYYGKTYYATWDPNYFETPNSTVVVQIQFANDTKQQVWSSGKTTNAWGFVAIDTQKEWLQGTLPQLSSTMIHADANLGFSMYNFTFHLLNYEPAAPERAAFTFDGPDFTLTKEPPTHYKAPGFTKVPNKAGLLIGLPVTLGVLVFGIIGIYFGMKKHRTIGVGNIMGRRKGYGVGKSKRQRMGLSKKGGGAIRLDEREEYSRPQYQPAHGHSDSLGSLVSDDGIRPVPGQNQFRSEIDRQRTGR
jgi:hypothetical protein